MKLKDVYRKVNQMRPNAFLPETITDWVNEAEGLVQTEVLLYAIDECKPYVWETDQETELLAHYPHDKIYTAYVLALMELDNAEYDKYNNLIAVFNDYFSEFARWYSQRYRPADIRTEPWKGFYFTAYGIALKHGFVGTEEEWLASLKGDKGDAFTYEDFTPEQIQDLKDGLVQGAIDEANAAAAAAGAARDAAVTAETGAAAAKVGAEAAKTAIENMTVSAKTLESGQPATVEKTENPDGTVNLDFGLPGGVRIDDTAPAPDKVYSSQKVEDELAKVSGSLPTFAVCYDAAAPGSFAANVWYVPKTAPRPSAQTGMMVDVLWKNGREDGIGYDVKLIWGEPDGADNELILDKTSTSDKLTGEHGIPVEGTVRYQLVELNGRNHWQYISGPLTGRQFSTAAAAEAADKAVPGMELAYLPGQEIFVQLDNGNTAETMRLIPDAGPTLPVYGNGTGRKTGELEAGYILQLKNAGDHWQIINNGGGGGGGVQIDDTAPSATKVYSSEKVNDTYKKKIEVATFKYGDVMVCSRTAEEMITGMDQGIEYVLDSGMDVAKRIAYVDKAQNKVVFYSVEPLISDGVTSSLDGKKVTVGPGNTVTVERMQSWEVTYADKLAWNAKPDIDDAAAAADKVYSSQKTEAAIKAAVDALGTVFDYKGSKATKADLPADDNQAGDVWFVVDESVGYVWLKEGRWEPFGPTIDLSGYVPKTTKINGKPLDKNIDLTAADIKARPETWNPDLSDYVSKSTTTPQTLNGNLSAKYLEGTWLKTTAATALPSAASKYAVIDPQGWVYYRTPEQVKADIGAQDVVVVDISPAASGGGWTSTMTADEIKAAQSNGKMLYARINNRTIAQIATTSSAFSPKFVHLEYVNSPAGKVFAQMSATVGDTVTAEMLAIPIPEGLPTGGTAGQFLVSDGNGGSSWLTLTNRKDVGA